MSVESKSRRGVDLLGLVGFGAVVAVAALIGSLAVGGTGAEYATLQRPGWARRAGCSVRYGRSCT